MDIKNNSDYKLIAEAYPRIALAIELHWGDCDFDKMMDKYLHDTRGGTRQGFPGDIGPALIRLALLHDSLYPKPDKDVWSDAYTPR